MEDIFGIATPLALSELEFFAPLASPAIEDSVFDDVYKELVGDGKTGDGGLAPESISAGELLDELDLEGGYGFGEPGWMTDKIDFTSLEAAALESETKDLKIDFTSLETASLETKTKDLTGVDSNLKFETIDYSFEAFVLPIPEESLKSCNVLMTSDTISPASPEQSVPDFAPLSPESSLVSPMSTLTDDSGISFASLENDATVAELLVSCGATALAVDQPHSPAATEDNVTTSSQKTQMEQTTYASVRATQVPYTQIKSKTLSYSVKPKIRTPQQKMRKREQNKDAATRYRVKKRGEQEQLTGECKDLEKVNKELKDQVNSLSKEIDYLKNLMLEVYKTRLQKQQLGISI